MTITTIILLMKLLQDLQQDNLNMQTWGKQQGRMNSLVLWQTEPEKCQKLNPKNYSEQIAFELDKEVKKIIDEKHELAKQILTENRDILDELAMSLLDHETINAEEFDELIEKVKGRRNQA